MKVWKLGTPRNNVTRGCYNTNQHPTRKNHPMQNSYKEFLAKLRHIQNEEKGEKLNTCGKCSINSSRTGLRQVGPLKDGHTKQNKGTNKK